VFSKHENKLLCLVLWTSITSPRIPERMGATVLRVSVGRVKIRHSGFSGGDTFPRAAIRQALHRKGRGETGSRIGPWTHVLGMLFGVYRQVHPVSPQTVAEVESSAPVKENLGRSIVARLPLQKGAFHNVRLSTKSKVSRRPSLVTRLLRFPRIIQVYPWRERHCYFIETFPVWRDQRR
jgi:hypothetical protein